jgi:DNA-directed RNA polymerase specialized sigma24 family protein
MKKHYDTIEEAYKEAFEPLLTYAKRHLYNKDEAIDCVHDAFEKWMVFANNSKKAETISVYLLYREVMRACRRRNKRASIEVLSNDRE